MPHPGIPDIGASKSFRFNDLPERIREKIRTRGAKRTVCWIWTGTIQPARQRLRSPRYVGRVHEVFGSPYRVEIDPALPQVWDGRKGAKVAAHRLIRSILTCVPIDDVPRLSRCADPRCVSPYHNIVVGPPPAKVGQQDQFVGKSVAVAEVANTAGEANVDVLAVLKEHDISTSFRAPEDFASIEEDCGLPPRSLTICIWADYVRWDAEENPNDD